MNTELQILGFEKAFKRLEAGARPAISRAVFKFANLMETTAKKNIRQSVYSSPKPLPPFKRTGKAQQSIAMYRLDDLQSKVYMGVMYGQYLERGTGVYAGRTGWWTTFGGLTKKPVWFNGMRARPFWKPAIETTKKAIPNILKSELEKI